MTSDPKTRPSSLPWLLLCIAFIAFAFLYSVINPLNALPDEGANMQYVSFLATHSRLPIWSLTGDSEGGYETQHPPLSFFYASIPFRLASFLPLNIQWEVARWSFVALGLVMLILLNGLSKVLFPGKPLQQVVFAATVALMPLSLMTLAHVNPDGFGLVISCAGLWACVAIYESKVEPKMLPVVGGLVAGLAALTKLSVLPIAAAILIAQLLRKEPKPEKTRNTATIIVVAAVVSGWYYVRSLILYHSLFIHTKYANDTGIHLGHSAGYGLMALFTLRETYLSTWAQRGWFPYELDITYAVVIGVVILLSIVGLNRKQEVAADVTDADADTLASDKFRIRLCVGIVAALLLAQQLMFWFEDTQLNAGGRYLLIAMPAIAYIIVRGISSLGATPSKVILSLWVLVILSMNIVAANRIVNVLTPRYFPGWQMFQFAK